MDPLIIGIAASTFTALCLFPQLIKIVKEKEAENISLPMLGIMCTGLALWIVYGVMKRDVIIIVSNSISVTANLVIILLAVKYKRK